MKKIAAISLGVLAAVTVAWLGAGIWVGQRAQTALQELKDGPSNGNSSVRLTQLKHERGLFDAKGQAELTFEPGCAAATGADLTPWAPADVVRSVSPAPPLEWQAPPTWGPPADGDTP